jgi:RNA polymerase sigma factor (sigma-70 family)
VRSDAELVASADAGDSSAWNELVDRHGQLVYANARAVGADDALAQDVGQLVWMRLMSRLGTIREPDKVRGWLAIVARNTARSELRRRKPVDDLEHLFALPDPNSPQPETQLARSEAVEAVRAALVRISERCRELLTLLFSAEMSYDEISETAGMPIGSIGPTRQRCLDALARHLSGNASTI